MNPALTRKTSLVFAVAVFAFTLGGYIAVLSDACAEFKEGGGAWTVVIGSIVGLAASGFALVYDAWKSRREASMRLAPPSSSWSGSYRRCGCPADEGLRLGHRRVPISIDPIRPVDDPATIGGEDSIWVNCAASRTISSHASLLCRSHSRAASESFRADFEGGCSYRKLKITDRYRESADPKSLSFDTKPTCCGANPRSDT
jgi:hypothetical protein